MKSTAHILLFTFILITGLIGCKKDKETEDPVTNEPTVNVSENEPALNLGNSVNAKFFIQIIDEAGNRVPNVNLNIGNKSGSTDDNGILFIENASVKEKLAYITAKKSGYFPGSRSMTPSTNTVNNVKITLLALDIVDQVQSGENATVSLANGVQLDLRGEYILTSGNTYNGTVDVAIKYLPPLADETPNQMPGMLYAQNEEEESGFLETYGMVAIELFGSNGTELQLADGSSATLHMPVDPMQLANAPQTIPLWHFDETVGYWIEEGEATLVNGEYVGDVGHFSFWNCDVFTIDATLEGTITDNAGNPISSVDVKIITPNASTTGLSSPQGTFFTYIPANEMITVEIIDQCGAVLGTWTGGPFNPNSNNSITIGLNSGPNSNFVHITGSVYDCNNDLVSNGYVTIDVGPQSYYQTLVNGAFDVAVIDCNNLTTLTLNAYDLDNVQVSGALIHAINSPTTNLGNIIACTTPTEYISYTIDNDPPVMFLSNLDCRDTLSGNDYGIYTYGFDPLFGHFYLTTESIAPGIYNYWQPSTNPSTGSLYITGIANWGNFTHSTQITVNTFGAIGTMVDITFSGVYLDLNNVSHTITGAVHVIRTG